MRGNVSIKEDHKRKVEMVSKDSMVKMVIKNVDKDEDVGEDSIVVEDVGEDRMVVEDSMVVEDLGEDSAVALLTLDMAEVMIKEKLPALTICVPL